MELHAHDPLRYTGDMLGWLHQAAASEREHVTTLLKQCTHTTGMGEQGLCSELMGANFAACTRISAKKKVRYECQTSLIPHLLVGDKVSMLPQTHPRKPLSQIKVTICNHEVDSLLHMWPDV